MTSQEKINELTQENMELKAECSALKQKLTEIEAQNNDLRVENKKLVEKNESD